MKESVTFKGKEMSLLGAVPKEGDKLFDCELTNEELKGIKLSSYKGKVLVLVTVPSLDTAVCSREAHRFNKELERFNDQLTCVTVSMDLPFAQKRWCAAEGVKGLVVLSDFKKRELGEKLGILLPDLGLLARTVFICDEKLVIRHRHVVKEVTEEPNYSEIVRQIEKMLALK